MAKKKQPKWAVKNDTIQRTIKKNLLKFKGILTREDLILNKPPGDKEG